MHKKIAIICCIAALCALAGCKKINAFFNTGRNAGAVEAASATPAPAAAAAEETPAPTPPPMESINKSAAAIALCYHNIEDSPKMRALTISTAEFARQMQALKDNGFTVIGMQDFLAWRRGERDIPAKSAIITIDDGWISTYDNAWPILKKFGYPFTVFIYVNYVNSGGKSMTWDQLAELRDAGVDIQSHTFTHGDLRSPFRPRSVDAKTMAIIKNDVATLGLEGWMRKEIAGSKQELEKQLGIKVNVLAYPFGNFNQKVRELVKDAGYEAAFTVYGQQLRHGSPPIDLLGRYAVDASKPQIFYADALKMVGGGLTGPAAPVANVAQLAAASMITQPMEGETISNDTPLISANLAAMGAVEPASVEMRVSGMGLVPAKYDPATKTVSYQVTQKLRDKDYSVILSARVQGKRVETRWTFKFDPNAGASEEPAYSLPGAQ